jgi:hypothetical protein
MGCQLQIQYKTSLMIWALTALFVPCSAAIAAADTSVSEANTTLFGPNVYVFDPTMPSADIQNVADGIFKKMETDQFGPERYALLFKPGTYNVDVNIGFYTQVAGLGLNPDDVQIIGGTNVTAKWDPHGDALDNFWRSLENLAVTPLADEQYGIPKGITRIAVSQAAPLRRLHIKGDLELFDFGPNGNAGYASGGFLADSIVDGRVVPGSQQQWLARNSQWSQWNNSVWNMVFVGCSNTPLGQFPDPPYTVVDKTPIIREKPYLYINDKGGYNVFVPSTKIDSQGVSWSKAPTPGASVPLDRFFVARPELSTAAVLNAALMAGKNILFTPGVYSLSDSLHVTRPNTIILGLGVPSLIATNGKPIISVADVGGVEIAGLILDAGQVMSPQLLQVGPRGCKADHSSNPTFLYDLSVRTGGAAPGKDNISVEINSNDVVVDQMWVWRADHGSGIGWASNPTINGLVVNGNDVTIYGLFNEHHEGYQTLWNGNGGRVYMYQSEMPYDVPSQADWMSGNTKGFASYKVAGGVTRHQAWGVGIYCFFRDAAVSAANAVEAPSVPGIRFHHLTTIWLSGKPGSGIDHIVDGIGGAVFANNPPSAMRQTLDEFP